MKSFYSTMAKIVHPGQFVLDFTAQRPEPQKEAKPPLPVVSDVSVAAASIVEKTPNVLVLKTDAEQLLESLRDDHARLKSLYGQAMPLIRKIERDLERRTDHRKVIEMIQTSQETLAFLKWGMRTKSAEWLFGPIRYDPNSKSVHDLPLIVVIAERKCRTLEEANAVAADLEALLDLSGGWINVNARTRKWSVLDLVRSFSHPLPSFWKTLAEVLRERGAKTGEELDRARR